MWIVDPSVLCRQHLLGEHVECHMLRGALLKGTSLAGFVDGGLVDSRQLLARHDALAREMASRGYRHASPMLDGFIADRAPGVVDVDRSMRELASRCDDCRARIGDRPYHEDRARGGST